MKSKSIKQYYQQGGTVEPDATKVHNNIDNLILQAELDKLAQTGSMRIDRTPEYIGGLDPIVENVALSPILTLKSLGSVGKKILEKTGLRNPITHYTSGSNAARILKSEGIHTSSLFPGTQSKTNQKIFQKKNQVPGTLMDVWSSSITRDPMFPSRPHGAIPTDVGLILDRDDMIRKGFRIRPIAVSNYEKTTHGGRNIFFKGKPKSEGWWIKQKDIWGKDAAEELKPYGLEITTKKMNPKFEFEERIAGQIPTENVKLINLLRLPENEANLSPSVVNLINKLVETDIPIMQSDRFSKQIKGLMELIEHNASTKHPYHKEFLKGEPNIMDYLEKIRGFPTYKFDPFKGVR